MLRSMTLRQFEEWTAFFEMEAEDRKLAEQKPQQTVEDMKHIARLLTADANAEEAWRQR